MLLILPFHLPGVFWWKDESLVVLFSGHHRHRPKKTVLTGLIAVILKILLSHTKPNVTHRWSILVCPVWQCGLCCHWKCKSCFGRSVVSFHQVICEDCKILQVEGVVSFHCTFVILQCCCGEKHETHSYWIFAAEQLMVERLFHTSTSHFCLLWHLCSLAAQLWFCFDCELVYNFRACTYGKVTSYCHRGAR